MTSRRRLSEQAQAARNPSRGSRLVKTDVRLVTFRDRSKTSGFSVGAENDMTRELCSVDVWLSSEAAWNFT